MHDGTRATALRERNATPKDTLMTTDLLLRDFDQEMTLTRHALERVPDSPDYKPHPKSMPLGELAMHVATLPGLGELILTEPSLDVTGPNGQRPALHFESRETLLSTFDETASSIRAAIAASTAESLHQDWSLTAGDHVLSTQPRYLVYRQLFFNHFVHHRAQLGVYLRLNDILVPSTYGPSADEAPFPN
jgi:uncharacterized damage-inducible protein DinB